MPKGGYSTPYHYLKVRGLGQRVDSAHCEQLGNCLEEADSFWVLRSGMIFFEEEKKQDSDRWAAAQLFFRAK